MTQTNVKNIQFSTRKSRWVHQLPRILDLACFWRILYDYRRMIGFCPEMIIQLHFPPSKLIICLLTFKKFNWSWYFQQKKSKSKQICPMHLFLSTSYIGLVLYMTAVPVGLWVKNFSAMFDVATDYISLHK